ncbi:hypothetical protein [Burkholderia diffusa]|uniref:RiboL-PSP-HEPN domain-containing protein n=1 Tax=Burkholderia diffusa TaxID=488732 RepID=A0A6P2R9J2_9BURK|nr:hypothetical protein [Burkholderia diffusa]KAB0648376.1 hypothetical protein F7R23_30575 [Burkholderia diffusa]MBM2657041.1 hypothetical protein [Burkholderia diffusa]VWC29660.1 hypothetical protein BDI24065_06311 [Burkholderia diffusa]
MTRLTLTPDLPPQTAALKRFERTIEELNHFYWTFKCSLEFTLSHMAGSAMVPQVLSGQSASHLNIPTAKFIADAPTTERFARYSLLVHAVTTFEDYLKEVLSNFLVLNWKSDKTYKVSFRPEEIDPGADVQGWLRQRAVEGVVSEYLSRTYRKRFPAICTLLKEHGASCPTPSQATQDLASAACEARNCIVHAAGVVDARAERALASHIPGISIGTVLDVSEALLWQFLGALRDSGRALDVEIRALV